MNTNKFGKNRSVWSNWYTVPTVYLLDATGSNTEKRRKTDKKLLSFEEAKAKFDAWKVNHSYFKNKKYTEIDYEFDKSHGSYFTYEEVRVKGEPEKDLAIIQFYGNKALVGWRNNERASMGMTRLYPIIKKNKKTYLLYRGRKLEISRKKGGWVI